MAPEQAAAKKSLSTAVDVYSLGAILYEVLTGKPPFTGATPLDVLMQVLEKEPPPPRAVYRRVDGDLATIVDDVPAKGPGPSVIRPPRRLGRRSRPLARRPADQGPPDPLAGRRVWRWTKRNKLLSAACQLAALGLGFAAFLAFGALACKARTTAG